MVTIITGATKKPMSSEQLRAFFVKHKEYNGYLYIGYPIIGTVSGPYPIDALWVSPEKGVVIFNLIEGYNIDNYQFDQDNSYNKMEAKLKGYNQLVERRSLQVRINVITFAPIIKKIKEDMEYLICNEENLYNTLETISWQDIGRYNALLSVLQSISTIRKGKKKREVTDKESRGSKLAFLEDSIANLDNRQSRAVIETVEGVQRIRGLAGSGKTIVLALKAAYLHAQYPDWKIAITFNTRSLKGQFRQLINTFYIEQSNDEPDWDNVQIIHAWGAPGGSEKSGIYYNFCMQNNVEYLDFGEAKSKYYYDDNIFGKICEDALSAVSKSVGQIYDAILIDEAQDFSPSFLNICYEMLKEPKRLVYAYDELQSLSKQSLPSPEEMFGKNADGEPRVKFEVTDKRRPMQDIILEKCYRNSRLTLVTAHALGFGVYRKKNPKTNTGLVQIFDQSSLWNDIGYVNETGDIIDGVDVCLKRTPETSPEFLESHSPIDDLILFKKFDTKEEQDQWVADQIEENLAKDELRWDDIIVINPDPLTTREAVSPIRSLLFKKSIASHTAGVDYSRDVFFNDDFESVVFTGIYRAKGNEAAMVYIINAQDCYAADDVSRARNMLFTAITRSKAWVRVLGIGDTMGKLINEYEKVKNNSFKLCFTYPTEEQRKYMKIVNRDKSPGRKANARKKKSALSSIIKDLESGEIFIEDLNPEDLKRFKELLREE